MKPVEVVKGIYWVGAVDWNIRDFHGYSTKQGTTYNAFLIVDEKVALVDTVKAPFADDLIHKIEQIIDPSKIDMVISNHTEMDHTGSLPKVMQRIGKDKPIYCSKMGAKNIPLHFGDIFNLQTVKTGQEISLGTKTLSFIETRMIHWPDSMFTYCKEDKLLFSSDGFGQHLASLERFDDQLSHPITGHAKTYFANILMLYAPMISKLIQKVIDMNLEIDIIAPDHGLMWRKDPIKIIESYAKWCQLKPSNKAVVIYDTMWKSTDKMAEAIAGGLGDAGVDVKPMSLRTNVRSDVITEVMDAGIVAVGSPTLNNTLFPPVSDFLTYMKGLKPRNKIGVAFGSYGWSGEAPKIIHQILSDLNFNMPLDPIKVQYVPDSDALEDCYKKGLELGNTLKTMLEADQG